MNRFGSSLAVTLLGTSHGPSVGVIVDGVPAGLPLNPTRIQAALDRRRPVGRSLATKRKEPDRLELDEGIEDGIATGRSIRAHVANVDADPAAYGALRFVPRPGHADMPARIRFGESADLSGGGIFSGRMTIGLVIAGAVAAAMLETRGIRVAAYARAIAGIDAPAPPECSFETLGHRRSGNEVGAFDPGAAERMAEAIRTARREGDSVGGIVEARAFGLPVGLGEPFFDSIESEVAHLAFSIPAVKGVEFGDGFAAAAMRGSAHNDPYRWEGGHPVPTTNHAGGILGGLATGAPVVLRAAIKPTASIARPQESVDLRTGAPVRLIIKGRHDPCIVPRAVVVVESVLAFGLADLGLRGGYLK